MLVGLGGRVSREGLRSYMRLVDGLPTYLYRLVQIRLNQIRRAM
jgi:hypothetical protein